MAGRRTPRTTPEEILERERKVLSLRRSGMRFNRIALELGVSEQQVGRDFKRAMARHTEVPAAEIKQLEADRLDDLQHGLWGAAVGGHGPSVERVLMVMDRRAKLLGLDHSDKIAEQLLQLERDKVRLMAIALNAALDAIAISDDQRVIVFDTLERELASALPPDPDSPSESPAALPLGGGSVVTGQALEED